MIQLTKAALAYIESVIARDCPGGVFRLSVKKSGCSGLRYVPDVSQVPAENDVPVDIDGVSVFVDGESVDMVKGMTLDMVDRGMGQKQLIFHNPNATDSCGCGESFRLKGEADGEE